MQPSNTNKSMNDQESSYQPGQGQSQGQKTEQKDASRDSSSKDSKDSRDPIGISGVVSNFKTGATQAASKVQDVAGDLVSGAQEYGEMALEETSGFIKKYPAQSIAAGFGVGILVGYALSAARK